MKQYAMPTEMKKLINYLTDTPLVWGVEPRGCGWRVSLFHLGEEVDNAVWNPSSNGFKSGLLETEVIGGCKGYETAEQVLIGWLKIIFDLSGAK